MKYGLEKAADVPAEPCVVPPPLDGLLAQRATDESAAEREPSREDRAAGLDGSLRAIGETLLRVRRLSGVSQERVAKLAGVTQSALSRLEAGRGAGLIVLLRLGRVLPGVLSAGEDAALGEEVRRVLDALRALSSSAPGLRSVTRTPDVEELLALYRRAPRMARAATLAVLRTLAR